MSLTGKNNQRIITCLQFLGLGMCSLGAVATPLSMDSSFGISGRLELNHSEYSGSDKRSYFNDVENSPDGKFVAVGHVSKSASEYSLLVVKHLEDGSFDTSFDDDGKLILSLTDDDKGIAMAVQGDGKILVLVETKKAGTSYTSIEVIRFNVDGTLDQNFATNGRYEILPVTSPNTLRAKDIGLTSTGKIVVLYQERFDTTGFNRYDSKIIQLTTAGVPEPTFTAVTANPVVVGNKADHSIELEKFSFDDTDAIYVSGRMIGLDSGTLRFGRILGKYTHQGNTTNFGGSVNGVNFWYSHEDLTASTSTQPPQSQDVLKSTIVLADGNILSGGCDEHGNPFSQKNDASGNLVSSYGGNGVKTHSYLSGSTGYGAVCVNELSYFPGLGVVAIGQDNGSQFIATINENDGTEIQSSTGDLLFSSTNNGASTNPASSNGTVSAIAVLKNGKIIVAGTSGIPYNTGSHVDSSLIKFDGQALPSASFSINALNFSSVTTQDKSTKLTSNTETFTISPATSSISANVFNGTYEFDNKPLSVGVSGAPFSVDDGDNIRLSHVSGANDGDITSTYLIVSTNVGYHRNNNSWNANNDIYSFTSTIGNPNNSNASPSPSPSPLPDETNGKKDDDHWLFGASFGPVWLSLIFIFGWVRRYFN